MATGLIIELPADVQEELVAAANEEGMSEEVYAGKALKDYLFLRRFRSLREKMTADASRAYTDEDVFGIVS